MGLRHYAIAVLKRKAKLRCPNCGHEKAIHHAREPAPTPLCGWCRQNDMRKVGSVGRFKDHYKEGDPNKYTPHPLDT